MSKKEIIIVKIPVNLEDVMFEPTEDSGKYTMIVPTPNKVALHTEVTEKTKKEIEKLIMEGINNNENKR